jgi:ribokinase
MFDVIAIGSATQDTFVEVRSSKIVHMEDANGEQCYLALDYGAKINVDEVFTSTGGGATNTAVTFARMGLRTAAVCKVGRDSVGRQVMEDLRPDGIDTSMFAFDETEHTGFSVIIVTFTGDRTILVHRGASSTLAPAEIPWDALAAASWVYLGSMAGPSAALWDPIARFCGEHGVKLATNPGRPQRERGLKGMAEVYANTTALFVNNAEAREITGVAQERGPDDEVQMLKLLHEAGCRNAVITDGVQGADGYDGREVCHVPAYQVTPVSTVGAGDAFAAGCIVGLQRGLSLSGAMQVGAANSAHVVQGHGAKQGIVGWDKVMAFIAERGGL